MPEPFQAVELPSRPFRAASLLEKESWFEQTQQING